MRSALCVTAGLVAAFLCRFVGGFVPTTLLGVLIALAFFSGLLGLLRFLLRLGLQALLFRLLKVLGILRLVQVTLVICLCARGSG